MTTTRSRGDEYKHGYKAQPVLTEMFAWRIRNTGTPLTNDSVFSWTNNFLIQIHLQHPATRVEKQQTFLLEYTILLKGG